MRPTYHDWWWEKKMSPIFLMIWEQIYKAWQITNEINIDFILKSELWKHMKMQDALSLNCQNM